MKMVLFGKIGCADNLNTKEDCIEYSTFQPRQEIDENGVIYDPDSLIASFERICDPRQARGKRYRLTTLLTIIFLAKLCGQDTPLADCRLRTEPHRRVGPTFEVETNADASPQHHSTCVLPNFVRKPSSSV